MEPGFFNSRFSKPFTRLTLLGMWSADMVLNPLHRKLFNMYAITVHILIITGIVLQMIDLYLVFDNFRKVTYNFCTSAVIIGITIKMILLYDKKEKFTHLIYSLWKDSNKYNDETDMDIQNAAFSRLSYIRKVFYSGSFTVIPIWVVSSYFSYKWGPRHFAFAGYLPMKDVNDDATYIPALIYQTISAFYVIQVVIEADLTMLSVVLQMEAHYQILSKNLTKLNELYDDEEQPPLGYSGPKNAFKKEINKYLRKERTKKDLRLIVRRHLELLRYSQNFEHVFSRCMLVQVFAGTFLVVMNGLEIIMYINELSMRLLYQTMFVTLTVMNLYYICYHFTRLSSECVNVGQTAYGTTWYKMDPEIRKMLCLVITRAQEPPRFTSGKMFLMDLNAFMHMIKNIYSWLMLFRQLEIK